VAGAGGQSYADALSKTFGTQIEGLTLEPAQKAYLEARWLDQVSWLESKAAKAQTLYYRLRIVTVVGAVMIPALVGERWRNYRRTAEQLKTEGWLYFQLAGLYSVDGADHRALYGAFVKRVEEIVNSDVEVYLTEVVADRSKSDATEA
jgi:hypothetical protein